MSNVGRMDIECSFCKALRWPKEPSGFCCENGKVEVSLLPRPPHPLDDLLLGEYPNSSHFLCNIRSYNSAFQMTSMGCKQIVNRQWNPCFKIQGQVYHRIGSMEPLPDDDSKFAQIYFVGDEQQQTTLRQNAIPGVREDIVAQLQRMLHACNSYVRSLKFAHELLSRNSQSYKVLIDANKRPTGEHERRYNAPQSNEVAVLMVDEAHGKRDIVLRHRDNKLEKITETHRSYDPLHYPLIFSNGEDGYSIDYRTSKGKKVTAMTFYNFRLMVRPPPDSLCIAVVDSCSSTLLTCTSKWKQSVSSF